MPEPQPRRAAAPSAAVRAVTEAFRKASTEETASPAVPASLVETRRKRAKRRLKEALAARGTEALSAALGEELVGLVGRWAIADFGEGFAEVERFETRCFEAGELARAKRSGDKGRMFAAQEKKYRAAVTEEYGKIEIRGLQMSARVYQDLDLAYVPLRIEDPSQKREVIRAGEGIEISTVPRLSVPELLAAHERSIVVGAPGSGKTTIIAYLAARAATHRLHGEVAGWEASPVPFVVAVRSLPKGSRLDAEAIAAVSLCEVDATFVRRVLAERRGLLLVDGLDEAPGGATELLPALQAFAKAYPGNPMFVTTRPAGAVGSKQVEVPGFRTTTLLPMTREDVYLFIDKWCKAAEVSIQKDRGRAEEEGKRAADDLKSRVETSRSVERLAQTPLVCSVVCIVHRFLGQRVPERRPALYEACTNVLLYEWDRAKFPEGSIVGQLDAQDKRFLLGGVALSMHERKAAEISAADLVAQFAKRLPEIKRSPADAEPIVREIQFRSGVLIERRPGWFSFSHLTFQEYLTAVELVRAGAGAITAIINQHYENPWWHEVIALAAGLPSADAAGMVRALLKLDEGSEKPSTATFLAAHCAETAVNLLTSLRWEIDRRLETLLPPRSDDDVNRLVSLGSVGGPILLGALRTADARGRAFTCVALGRIGYEPAVNALVRLLSDQETPKGGISFCVGDMSVWSTTGSVASFAITALLHMAANVVPIRPVFEAALKTAEVYALARVMGLCQKDLRSFLGSRTWEYLDSIIGIVKAAIAERQAPKRAARSGSSPRKTAKAG